MTGTSSTFSGKVRSRTPVRPVPVRPAGLDRAAAWARRAPLMPALVFMVIITQLPFVATLVISLMDWNALYPDRRGFTGLANYADVFGDADLRASVLTTVWLTAVSSWSASCWGWGSPSSSTGASGAAAWSAPC